MGLAAVRIRIAGDDFHLLAEDDSPDSGAQLVRVLQSLRDDGGTLRLRPRTAPAQAPWVEPGRLEDAYAGGEATSSLTGDETPGTAWRDVLGVSIETVEAEELTEPTVLWHWAIGSGADREVG